MNQMIQNRPASRRSHASIDRSRKVAMSGKTAPTGRMLGGGTRAHADRVCAGMRRARLRRMNETSMLDGEVARGSDYPVGASVSFNSVLHMVRRVAQTQATVLFLGERGVGKEAFACMLHRLSARSAKAFVALNCTAIPESLMESELFGTERDAFTGAAQCRLGYLERADGGTLFLADIGAVGTGIQGKLLRALQQGEIKRLGSSHAHRIDVRIIVATRVDLRERVRAGRFREDLFVLLNAFPIRVASLRERPEDIPPLMSRFLAKFNDVHGKRIQGFTRSAVAAMLSYDWPGNVAELENVIERSVILAAESNTIDAPHLFGTGERIDENADPVSLDDIEALLLKKAVDRARGNLAAAARLLGITRAQIVYRLKRRGIGRGIA